MKIIDLLNKIAKGEEVPERIKYFGLEYGYCNNCKQYEHVDIGVRIKLFEEIVELDDEVEIIEEKIEKLPYYSLEKIQKAKNKEEHIEKRIQLLEKRIDDYHNKINEIIDKLNERENKNE